MEYIVFKLNSSRNLFKKLSQPPPAPPPITKCNLSIANDVLEIDDKRTVANTKLINFLNLLNIFPPVFVDFIN